MSTERTSLLPNGVSYGSTTVQPSNTPPCQVLREYLLRPAAEEVLLVARTDVRRSLSEGGQGESLPQGTGAGATPLPVQVSLAVYLHAVYLLEQRHPEDTTQSIRSRLWKKEEDDAVRQSLYRSAIRSLDHHTRHDVPDAAHTGGSGEDTRGPSHRDLDEDDDCLLAVQVLAHWPVDEDGNTRLSALDFMLPPYARLAEPILAHPAISLLLNRTWTDGVPAAASPGVLTLRTGVVNPRNHARLKAVAKRLHASITPRRIHFCHFVSFLVLYCLCLAVSLRPGRWAYNDTLNGRTLVTGGEDSAIEAIRGRQFKALEAVTGVWVVADFWSAFHFRPPLSRLLLISPLYLALPAYYFSHQLSFSLLATSLPFLTTLLVLPYYPSIPLLVGHTRLLPLSALLQLSLQQLLYPLLMFAPLLLLIMGLLSWSLNGDIWRGFLALPSPARTWADLWIRGPTEPGVAPFQTRLALFVTLVLLLLYAIILGVALVRASSAGRHSMPLTDGRSTLPSVPRWQSPSQPPGARVDDWEQKYGGHAAHAAREVLARAVQTGLGRSTSTIPVPSDAVRDVEEGPLSEQQLANSPLGRRSAEARQVAECMDHLYDPLLSLPVPLNQVFDTLELAHYGLILAKKLGWASASVWIRKVGKLGHYSVIALLGPVCWLLSFVL